MASVAVLTAVSKPKVCSVHSTSLSIVLGTQTTGSPFLARSHAICMLPSPPMAMSASNPLARNAAISSSERSISTPRPVGVGDDVAEWIAPVGGAEDGAAEVGDAADVLGAEAHHTVEGEQSFVAALDPVDLPAPVVGGQHHRADDGIESGGVAAAGVDGDTHACGSWPPRKLLEQFHDLARLGVSARGALLEKTSFPSTMTSNTPPELGISFVSMPGNAFCSSATRPVARGS